MENENNTIQTTYASSTAQNISVAPLKAPVNVESEKKQEVATSNINLEEKPSLPNFKYDEAKTIDENASDISELVANKMALEDERFVGEVAETKKEAIKESARVNKDIHLTKKEAEKIEALTEVDKAFFEQWKPILIWGGLKAPCKKTLATFLLWLILPFYTIVTITITLPISIIKTLFSAINNLLEEVKTFGTIARSIAFTLLIIGALGLIAFIIMSLLDKYNIIQIFTDVSLT
jgi:hypothetical protein